MDEDKRSRVMSYYAMAFIGLAPIGHCVAGWIAEVVGVAVTFLACGGIALVAAVVFQMQMPVFRSHLREAYVRRGIIPAAQDTRMGNP